MMNKVFKDYIGRNLEVYVDDMPINFKTLEDYLIDLEENFNVIKANKVRINPVRCTFGVRAEKFLGFMLTKKGN